MYEPPPSYVDFDSDVEDAGPPTRPYREFEMPNYGPVQARKPQPAAVTLLVAATNSKASDEFRNEANVLFLQRHLAPDDFEQVMYRMVAGEVPEAFSLGKVVEALATWGTARPTMPSSRCARRRLSTGARSARS